MSKAATQNQHQKKPSNKQLECVSTDCYNSATEGFMAPIKGCLTNKRYKIATKYVEHHSDMSYVHLQTDIIEDEF